MAEELKQLKINRRNAKGNLTRQGNALRRMLALENPDLEEIKRKADLLEDLFAVVELKHNELVEHVEGEEDYNTEEKWMQDCQDQFLIEKEQTRNSIRSLEKKLNETVVLVNDSNVNNSNVINDEVSSNQNDIHDDNVSDVNLSDPAIEVDNVNDNNVINPNLSTASSSSLDTNAFNWEGLLRAIALPRSQPKKFRGDPLRYHAFITAYKSTVSQVPDDGVKLQHLLSLCEGAAYSSIQYCVLKPAEEGYIAAIKKLKEKFGDPNIITKAWTDKILKRETVTLDTLGDFADDLGNCYGTLEALGKLSELDTMEGLSKVVQILPTFLRNKWKDVNFKLKENHTTATLKHLLEFVQKARDKEEDPVFGRVLTAKKPEKDKPNQRDHQRNHRPPTTMTLTDTKDSKKLPRMFCPYCNGNEHFLGGCKSFRELSKSQMKDWITNNNRCKHCARKHVTTECTLRKGCKMCSELHLTVLHDTLSPASQQSTPSNPAAATNQLYSLCQQYKPRDVFLKIVPVTLYSPTSQVDTYAVLDGGSMRTMLLTDGMNKLHIQGHEDSIVLKTVEHGTTTVPGRSVNVQISARGETHNRYNLDDAFSSTLLTLGTYSYPTREIKENYNYLKDVPLPEITDALPLVMIGADNVHLLTHRSPMIQLGINSPAAVHTVFGWTLHGPVPMPLTKPPVTVTTFTLCESSQLKSDVRRPWQVEELPPSKAATRSRLDQMAVNNLDHSTHLIQVDGVNRYEVPLLRDNSGTRFRAGVESVIPHMRRTERCYNQKPERREKHNQLIQKLVDDKLVKIITAEEAEKSEESWFVPHYVIEQKGKHRLVFNCSHEFQGLNLNKHLLAGPNLGSSLIGVILRFRQHEVAISGDIKAMFHQVRLKPEDQSLFRFIWRDCDETKQPTIYQWLSLLFGSTCSPCCATYPLQKLAVEHGEQYPEVKRSVMEAFYVDNCLDSTKSTEEAEILVHDIRTVLSMAGFNVRQWASNKPEVLKGLPEEALSSCTILEFQQDTNEAEPMLGMRWDTGSDSLTYRQNHDHQDVVTMRYIYRTLARQYDPIGFLVPFLIRGKLIVQDLWNMDNIDWDREITNSEIRASWVQWEDELKYIDQVNI
ncbi:uncharacterized protein [Antedon mediterranea]|uniref:uncharacterized protein n=1 Tax=Antedon mediterranea TaxID=105859 RepID=UPI003AF9696B